MQTEINMMNGFQLLCFGHERMQENNARVNYRLTFETFVAFVAGRLPVISLTGFRKELNSSYLDPALFHVYSPSYLSCLH